MTRIRILPEILSNKIAAGEVIERPASVVKELLENALDAGSTRIDIEVNQGGRSLIRVADNGRGMSRDDALLALERYATSKIRNDSDLFAIRTLGFRGEALPSITSVSRLTLITCGGGGEPGTEIEVSGGRIMRVKDTGAPPGTMITVRQLFFNTPARRKFLKTVSTEMGHIADAVVATALAWPQVHFRLRHNGREVKNWPSVEPDRRAADVLGDAVGAHLHRIEAESDGIAVGGQIAAPDINRRTWRGIHLYVNGRPVRDPMVQHALLTGYAGRLMRGQYPLAVLFVTLPPDQVDVNVHPTKHQVRFARPGRVRDAITRAVSETLRRVERPPWETPSVPAAGSDRAPGAVSEPPKRFRPLPSTPHNGRDRDRTRIPAAGAPPSPSGGQIGIWEGRFLDTLSVIGQYRETYILCESPQGLVIVDQHAAHERIVYERLRKSGARRSAEAQRLLVPETFELGFREAALLERLLGEWKNCGLEIEPFGGNTFRILTVPSVLAGGDVQPLITAVIENMLETGTRASLPEALDESLKVIACHNAIRARQRLAGDQIRPLLRQLSACENPAHCPHGRPVWIVLDDPALEKRFGRIP